MPTYADVRVDLAKAFLEHKVKSDWPRQVDTLLKRALELDPENAKAKFVYARFYFAEETRDYAKAEPYLTAAPFDSTSLFMLAQALSNRGVCRNTERPRTRDRAAGKWAAIPRPALRGLAARAGEDFQGPDQHRRPEAE